MKPIFYALTLISLFAFSCKQKADTKSAKDDIFNTEKAFEKMCAEKGIAAAFEFYADENAVILRENDSLIRGKENIGKYYASKKLNGAVVKWTPDFIDVSEDATIGYTYGKYSWQQIGEKGDTIRSTGVFHTVWKKQVDGNWKYVWD